ncbi:hypothetical protein M422DRAFT_257414 [Sphaerobolus stellatus SS14]|uniref:Uncharacterized protein n=1 Tax=Sphaerobolus stellatus (strain SS14) TaxID=990650 RepID=A0A0C9VNZ7_SPHS4|nr:hypothetical protein M422DRAFT_257414 [Sphaerobolus stellatus SS14]
MSRNSEFTYASVSETSIGSICQMNYCSLLGIVCSVLLVALAEEEKLTICFLDILLVQLEGFIQQDNSSFGSEHCTSEVNAPLITIMDGLTDIPCGP